MTRKRQYVPHKQAHRKFEEIKASTWFAGGSWQDKVGTIAGNFDYPALLSPQLAKRIIDQKNAWSVLLVAFLDNQTETWIKAEQLPSLPHHLTRQEAEAIIQPALDRFAASHNARQLISVSWFMVPVPELDLLSQRTAIADILEREGAADRLLVSLAHDQRLKDIERLEAQQHEAAAC